MTAADVGCKICDAHGAPLQSNAIPGGVAERLIAPVLKTGRPKGLVSSNLTPSAPNFRFAIADFRLVPGENAPLTRHRKFPGPPRIQRRRDNVRRCTSARIRSELGLGDRPH